MPWEIPGMFWLNPGKTIGITFWWDNGTGMPAGMDYPGGAVYPMAYPNYYEEGNPRSQSLQMNNIRNTYNGNEGFFYYVEVTNVGVNAARFDLRGLP